MKKKIFGAVLAGVMSLSLLAGCGSDNKNPVEAMKDRFAEYVDLGEYKGIQYTPTHTEVTDSQVESKLQSWLMGYAETVEDKTSAAALGDKVNIDYVGYIDGVAFEGGDTKGAGSTITLGSSGYIPGFDDQIVGHVGGETFDVVATFPENYGKEELNGKEATFKTTLNYISKTEYPELTDAFVAEKTEYDTIDAYRVSIKEDLVKQAAESDKETDKDTVMDQAVENAAVKQYPEKEMKERIAKLTSQITSAASSYGMTLDQYIMAFGYTADDFQNDIRTGTESYIKRKMAVAAIAAKEKIEVSKSEADQKIQELLKATGITDVNTLNTAYGYSEADYYYIVLETKVTDFVYENAVAKDASETTEASEAVEDTGTEAEVTENDTSETAK